MLVLRFDNSVMLVSDLPATRRPCLLVLAYSQVRKPGAADSGGAAASRARSGTGRHNCASLANAAWMLAATESTMASPPRGPTIWRPNGRPASSRPIGMLIAG